MKSFLILLCPALLLTGCVALPYESGEVYYPAPAISATISSGHHHHHRDVYHPPAPVIVAPRVHPAPVIVAPHVRPAPVIVAPRGAPPPRNPGAQVGNTHQRPGLQDGDGRGRQYRDAPRRDDGGGRFRDNRGDNRGSRNGAPPGRHQR